ncbi:MAG: 23S rRNA (uridine(2552)-2'-O)-methyltransferase RlmE [Betaproteobacteria bacterium]|nr:23S rRNA (uridine(2552)-2'-O)-methyltransferase RlmE [Betaproteobacteria bacterium]
MKRTKSGRAWMREHVTDPYVRQAKREGYRSRAAYKLQEIDDRDRLLKPGMTVVDLGSAPGGWSQVAADSVGPKGRVIAVDLLEMRPVKGVTFLQGDFRESAVLEQVERALGGRPADLVICDMAPNISGIGVTDQARSMHLAELALEFCRTHLKPGGALLVKAFQGAGFRELVATLRSSFSRVAVRKPKASRDRSSEVYLLAQDKR